MASSIATRPPEVNDSTTVPTSPPPIAASGKFFTRTRAPRIITAAQRERARRLRRQRNLFASPMFTQLLAMLDRFQRLTDELREFTAEHWFGCECTSCTYLTDEWDAGWKMDLVTLESVAATFSGLTSSALPLPMKVGPDGKMI